MLRFNLKNDEDMKAYWEFCDWAEMAGVKFESYTDDSVLTVKFID